MDENDGCLIIVVIVVVILALGFFRSCSKDSGQADVCEQWCQPYTVNTVDFDICKCSNGHTLWDFPKRARYKAAKAKKVKK